MTEPALSFALNWYGRGVILGLTYLSALDVVASATDLEDHQKRREFLENTVVLSIPITVVRSAEKLFWTTALPTRLTADDAIAAITALNVKLPLYSLDPERYAGVPGLTVLPAR